MPVAKKAYHVVRECLVCSSLSLLGGMTSPASSLMAPWASQRHLNKQSAPIRHWNWEGRASPQICFLAADGPPILASLATKQVQLPAQLFVWDSSAQNHAAWIRTGEKLRCCAETTCDGGHSDPASCGRRAVLLHLFGVGQHEQLVLDGESLSASPMYTYRSRTAHS